MKISLNWIKEFVNIPEKLSTEELAELLTLRTCEVESFEDQAKGLSGVVVGEMLEFHKHPDADKLHVAKVDIGKKEPLNLIFGSMVTMHVGDHIPVAVAPTTLPTGQEIVAKPIRGAPSEGMLCLEQELGMKETGVSILYFPNTKPGTPLAEALGLDDTVFEIDNKSITHRPDLWGHYGMAREFSAFLDAKLKSLAPKVTFPKKGISVKIDIEKSNICNRFLSVIVSGIKVEESPQWMKSRLEAAGMRSVNNIVDITNYAMLEIGYPMHAFDRRTVGTDHFVVRFAKQNETIEAIDHKKRTLHPEDALITNSEKALGIAGIIGGANSEITDDTTEIILEVGNWNPIMIRKTSQRHALRTDAAQRFEKSLDPEMAYVAFMRACELIIKICPNAKFLGPYTDEYMKKFPKIEVLLNIENACKKIGAQISEKDMSMYLTRLGFTVTKSSKGVLKIIVPSWRATKDVNIEDDVIEEIARMYGYEKIVPALPELPIRLPRENHERKLKHWARDILGLALGFTETMLYSFYSLTDAKKCLLPEEPHLQIENPLSEDQTHLRISLLPNLLKSVARNLNLTERFNLFEIGRQYRKNPGSHFPIEEKMIMGVIVSKADKEVFYGAKGAVEKFLELFPGFPSTFEESKTPPVYSHPKKCADILTLNDKKTLIGRVFELSPIIAKNFDISAHVAIFEINFSLLASLPLAEIHYKSLPKFPGIDIDVSVLAKNKAKNSDITKIIKHSDQSLIKDVKLIDRFEDAKLGEGKKSLTYRVYLQANDRTLTDQEMTDVQKKIFNNLQKAGYIIRGL